MKFVRSIAARLESAREALATAEAKIGELQRQREAALIEADDLAAVHSIEFQIEGQRRNAAILTEQITVLESKIDAERALQREANYKSAVDKIAATLPRRAKAAEQVERALANLAAATKEFLVSTENVLKAWPSDVEFPPRAYPGHCLSLERLGTLVRDVFVPSRGHADRRPPQPAEFVTRAADCDRHRAFAAIERQLGEEWLSDLRTAHNPAPAADTAEDDIPNEAAA